MHDDCWDGTYDHPESVESLRRHIMFEVYSDTTGIHRSISCRCLVCWMIDVLAVSQQMVSISLWRIMKK